MRSDKRLPLLVVALLVATSGCQWYTSTTMQGTSIDFEGSLNVSETGFTIEGKILNIAQEGDQRTFENVSVYLYDENKTVIDSVHFDQLGTESPRFSLQSRNLPEYIIIYSDEFWGTDEFEVKYYTRIDTEREIPYDPEWAASKDNLPVVPGSERNTTTGSP